MVLILPVLKNFPGDYQPGEVIGGGGGGGKNPSLKIDTQNPSEALLTLSGAGINHVRFLQTLSQQVWRGT